MGLRRLGRAAGAGLALVAAVVTLICVHLRLDKTHVFYQVRGTYADGRVLESWHTAGSATRRIELRNRRGEAVVETYIRRPSVLDPRYRVLLTYAGAKTGPKIFELIPERSDLVVVALQYPYQSPGDLMGQLRWPRDVRQAVFRTVAGGMLAVSHLREQEGLDLDRLVILGSSLGSVFATLHGALDERVPVVVLVHGGGDLATVVRDLFPQRWLGHAAGLGAAVLFHSFEPLDYIDRISPRALVMVCAEHDLVFTPESAERLLARAREPKRIIWTDSGHVRSKHHELLAQIIREIETLLDEQAGTVSGP